MPTPGRGARTAPKRKRVTMPKPKLGGRKSSGLAYGIRTGGTGRKGR